MKKILIVDDDRYVHELFKKLLVKHNFTTVHADNGKEAKQILVNESVDLVITDVLMPEEDGLDVIFYLKSEKPEIPIFAMSGGGRIKPKKYLDIARKLGAKEVIEKPFSLESVIDKIKVELL